MCTLTSTSAMGKWSPGRLGGAGLAGRREGTLSRPVSPSPRPRKPVLTTTSKGEVQTSKGK